MSVAVYKTAWGQMTMTFEGEVLTGLSFTKEANVASSEKTPFTERVYRQLEEYFAGKRKVFEIPVKPAGTPFQQQVWQALCAIPYGATRTYGEIAAAMGNPKAARAVGMANNKNPILILIPCHRVIGADGSLTGYAGGLDLKERLLRLEQGES